MKHAIRLVLATMSVLTVFSVNCAAKKTPKLPPDPKFTEIQNVSVLPAVDARPADKAKVNVDRIQNNVVKELKRKRYNASPASSLGEAGQIDVDDLDQAAPAFIKKLGPQNERWVMIVLLGDVHSKITFGSTGNAEVSGYLFDKESGTLVWKGTGKGAAGQGGLLGMAMKGMMNDAALDSATYSLLATIPQLPKPGK